MLNFRTKKNAKCIFHNWKFFSFKMHYLSQKHHVFLKSRKFQTLFFFLIRMNANWKCKWKWEDRRKFCAAAKKKANKFTNSFRRHENILSVFTLSSSSSTSIYRSITFIFRKREKWVLSAKKFYECNCDIYGTNFQFFFFHLKFSFIIEIFNSFEYPPYTKFLIIDVIKNCHKLLNIFVCLEWVQK